ncbi:MAG: PQQ-dependent sugar dehydrogenase [Bacteroidota bacterium]
MKKKTHYLLAVILIVVCSFSIELPFAPPPAPIGPYLNGIFPDATPGGTWELEDPLSDFEFIAPLRIHPLPGSSDLLLLCKIGEIWRISLENQTRELILDIKDRCFKKGEGGSVGMALHPEFGNPAAPDKQLLFLFYRTKPEPDVWNEQGFNRLSKFTWDPAAEKFSEDSEQILFQQFDRMTWHNGGGMFFGPDDFLYMTLGDEGDTSHIAASTQRLDGGFFSGIIRIDVDKDPTRSHPIRRQPLANAAPPAGWGETYSQDYFIPNDNPWLSPDSSHLEEFFAIGTRSPYGMYYDEENQQIWVTDVGSSKAEEINIVEKGDNLQWPFVEGVLESTKFDRPSDVIGAEKSVFAWYDRNTHGSCIIGGEIYRGTLFPELNGKFLFADWMTDKLMALNSTSSNEMPEIEILIPNIGSQPEIVPDNPGIAGIFPQPDGEVLITVMSQDVLSPGKILLLKRNADVPEPPSALSELGVFEDLASLTLAPGIIPYGVNSPLWSDRAIKKRWIALPNDGIFDSSDEQIEFSKTSEWKFPEGTVFIKHFELPLSEDAASETSRLETRFFIIGKHGKGYGLTYKWNEEGTDAFLLGGGTSKEFDIYENGTYSFTQTWNYPSRDQCLTCHTPNAKYVLGVNTHQLNGEIFYPEANREINQLEYLKQYNVFRQDPGNINDLPKSAPIHDESRNLDDRIKSYLDANCSSCHRPDGINTVNMDFRYSTPFKLKNLISAPTQSEASNQNLLIVEPGSHLNSELWIRDASLAENRMPPLAHNLIDEEYIDALVEWIDELPEDAGIFTDLLLYPNPTQGRLNIRLNDDWMPPYRISIHDGKGTLLYQEITSAKSTAIDFSDHPAGTYFLSVGDGGNNETEKFIVL